MSEEFYYILLFCVISVFFHFYHRFNCSTPVLYGKVGSLFKQIYNENSDVLKNVYSPPFWCIGARRQTILRFLFQRSPVIKYDREILILKDGGQVALDWVNNDGSVQYTNKANRPTVILLPGLTGSSETSYIRQLCNKSINLGYRVVVFNMRGQGGADLKTPTTYCATSHADVAEVVEHVHSLYPAAFLMACGISLGGMVLTHYMAHSGLKCPLSAAALFSTVWDPVMSSRSLETPLNKVLLNWPLCSLLRRCVATNRSMLASRFPHVDAVLRCSTVRQFDTLITAPMFGYPSCDDYYQRARLTPQLARLKVPTLALTSRDDPFAPENTLPFAEVAQSDHLLLLVTERGGHLGFLEGVLSNGNFMVRAFADFVQIMISKQVEMGVVRNL